MNHISKCVSKRRNIIDCFIFADLPHDHTQEDMIRYTLVGKKNGVFISPFGLNLLWLSFPKSELIEPGKPQNPSYAYPSIPDLSLKLCPPHNCHDFQRILLVATEKMLIMFMLVPTSSWCTWRDAAKLRTGHTRV